MRYIAALLTVLLTAVLNPAPAAAATPSAKIVYVQGGDIWFRIGPLERQLTTGGGNSWPRLSPDRSEIAFVHFGDLWTLRLAGDELRQLTFTGTAGGPSWHPAGNLLAYRSGDALFTIDPHATVAPTLLAPAARPLGTARDADWSPLRDADPVAWSPDGRSLAFSGGQCRAVYDDCLTVLELSTQLERTVVGFGGGGINSGFATTPAWSADSRFLYFTEQMQAVGTTDIGPTRAMEFDSRANSVRQIGTDGDSTPVPLGAQRFLAVSRLAETDVISYLQTNRPRSDIATGTQPDAR